MRCLYALSAMALAQAASWMDPNDTPSERAHALRLNMTTKEKISLLHGIGELHDLLGYVGAVKGVPRVGIPDIRLNDGPQGFRCGSPAACDGGSSTQFPSGLTIAATWSTDSALAWGEAMGTEFYNKGATVQLGPGMCLARVPRNGRNFEYMSGEDPTLGATLVPGAIRGIQSKGVVANAKHFVLNNQETKRMSDSVEVDERTLFEMYLPPFVGAVKAGVGRYISTLLSLQWPPQTLL